MNRRSFLKSIGAAALAFAGAPVASGFQWRIDNGPWQEITPRGTADASGWLFVGDWGPELFKLEPDVIILSYGIQDA